MYDKLDLLGVRFDAELELGAMYEFAEKLVSKCKHLPTDELEEYCLAEIREHYSYESDKDTVYDFVRSIIRGE